jgi:hypothetical protein
MPVILATWEAEIRRIMVRGWPTQIVCETLSRNNQHKKGNPVPFRKEVPLNLGSQMRSDLPPLFILCVSDVSYFDVECTHVDCPQEMSTVHDLWLLSLHSWASASCLTLYFLLDLNVDHKVNLQVMTAGALMGLQNQHPCV